ncbi:Ankyrin repeat-containing domain protein [Elaphomyces granulatus]
MPFSDLPREILFEIAYHLDDAGMNALCRTNRQIYDFLNGYLYRRDLTRRECKSLFFWSKIEIRGGRVDPLAGTVQQAIAAGRHLDPIPKHYSDALECAWMMRHTGLFELLLREGINCDLDHFLSRAVFYCRADFVKLLLAVPNVDPNVMVNSQYGGKFHILAYSVLEANIDPNVMVDSQYGGKFEGIVKLLLDHPDIDPNCVSEDANGGSPLVLAVDSAMLKLLLDREGIDVNKQDAFGRTALMHQISFAGLVRQGSTEGCELLLNRDDVDLNIRDENGQTALFWACSYDNVSTIDLLLKKEGIDPNARDIDGCTPLGYACYFHGKGWRSHQAPDNYAREIDRHLDDVAKVRLLLSRPDTDPNPVDNDGVSLLSHVVLNITPLYGGLMELLLRAAGALQRCIQSFTASKTTVVPCWTSPDRFLLRAAISLERYQKLGPRQKHMLWLFLSSFSLLDLLCEPRLVVVAKDWMLPERQLREPRHEQCRILKQDHAQLKQQLHELVEVTTLPRGVTPVMTAVAPQWLVSSDTAPLSQAEGAKGREHRGRAAKDRAAKGKRGERATGRTHSGRVLAACTAGRREAAGDNPSVLHGNEAERRTHQANARQTESDTRAMLVWFLEFNTLRFETTVDNP